MSSFDVKSRKKAGGFCKFKYFFRLTFKTKKAFIQKKEKWVRCISGNKKLDQSIKWATAVLQSEWIVYAVVTSHFHRPHDPSAGPCPYQHGRRLRLSFLCYFAFIYWNICVKCWWVKKRRRKKTVIGVSVHRKDCFCREPIVFYRIVRKPPTRPLGIKWLPKASLCQSRNVRLVQYKKKDLWWLKSSFLDGILKKSWRKVSKLRIVTNTEKMALKCD